MIISSSNVCGNRKLTIRDTVKALTEELCLLEQKLKQRDVTGSSTGNNNVALLTKSESNHTSVATASGVKKGKKVLDKKKVRCYNCNKIMFQRTRSLSNAICNTHKIFLSEYIWMTHRCRSLVSHEVITQRVSPVIF